MLVADCGQITLFTGHLCCVCVCVCVCLSVCGGVGVWAKVVFPTGIYMQILVAMGIQWGMACLSVHMYIGAGGVR